MVISVRNVKKYSRRVIALLVLIVSIEMKVVAEERRSSTVPPVSPLTRPSAGRLVEEDLPPAPANPSTTSLGFPPAAETANHPSTPPQPSPGYAVPIYPSQPTVVPSVPSVTPPVPLPGTTVPLSGPVLLPPRPSVVTNVPPPLPSKDTFSPEERVALHFVEEGQAALLQNNLDRAQERFERAVAMAPFQPYSYYFLSRVAFARGVHQQALAFAHKAELLFARSDETWRGETASLKGIIYEDIGDYVHARVAYQRCLQLVPGHLKAMTALARLSETIEIPVQTTEAPVQNVSIP